MTTMDEVEKIIGREITGNEMLCIMGKTKKQLLKWARDKSSEKKFK